LLAFSSLHRYGLQPQAAKLKISALKALTQASAAPNLGPKETIEHTATGMLLCSFEVHISSCSSDEWMAYLAGVETVISASNIDTLIQLNPEVVVLMDWVHYYHVLARFSLLYWERDGTPELPPTPPGFFSLTEVRTQSRPHGSKRVHLTLTTCHSRCPVSHHTSTLCSAYCLKYATQYLATRSLPTPAIN